jgi:hypothetical protein
MMGIYVYRRRPLAAWTLAGGGTLSASLALFAGLVLSASLGCSGGKSGNPNGRPASGTVAYKGQPVEGATVSFISLGASAFGATDAQGKFKLRASDGDKVALGDYQVTVVKKEFTPPPPPPSEQDYVPPDPDAPPPPEPKDLLPAKYKRLQETPLKFSVTAAGPNDFTIEPAD